MARSLTLAAGALAGAAALPYVPSIALKNAAAPGTLFPLVGLGMGGYSGYGNSTTWGSYPECMNGCNDPECAAPDPPGFQSCAQFVEASVGIWVQLGGRRIDSAGSYHNQLPTAIAMNATGVPRSELFFVSKVGQYLAMGYDEAAAQLATTLAVTGLGYVDLALVHWPTCGGTCNSPPFSKDPVCVFGAPTYDEKACRLDTYRALVDAFRAGKARAIGVSNYNCTHLQEIEDAGLPLPAVNQIPYFLYHSSVQAPTLACNAAKGVLTNGYSPIGVPDRHSYAGPPPKGVTTQGGAADTLADPVLLAVAAAHSRTPAEVTLAWQLAMGVPSQPRSQNAAHMLANLQFFDIVLTPAEIAALSSRPQSCQPTC